MRKLLLSTGVALALAGSMASSATVGTLISEQFRGHWYGFQGTVEHLIINGTEVVLLPAAPATSPRTTCTPTSIRHADDPPKGGIALTLICNGSTYPALWAVWKIGGEDVLIVAELESTAEYISGYRRRPAR